MIKGVIAEIGNMHFGDMDVAKEMIRVAKECGAHYVKMQAIEPECVSQFGTMPLEFYEKCSLTLDEYKELREYANEIGTNLFFSIFGDSLEELEQCGLYKISGEQFLRWDEYEIDKHNFLSTVVSIPHTKPKTVEEKKGCISNMHVMYRCDYLPKKRPEYGIMSKYAKILNKNIGYSDHNKGIDECKYVIDRYRPNLVEKHFFLGEKIAYDGHLFRDSSHSANPDQFSTLVRFYEEKIK